MPDPLDKQLVEAVLTRPRRARADVEEAKLATRGLRAAKVVLPKVDDDEDDDEDLVLGGSDDSDGGDVAVEVVGENGEAVDNKLPAEAPAKLDPAEVEEPTARGARRDLRRRDRDRRSGPDVPPEIARVPLLTAEEEVVLAKAIELGEQIVGRAVEGDRLAPRVDAPRHGAQDPDGQAAVPRCRTATRRTGSSADALADEGAPGPARHGPEGRPDRGRQGRPRTTDARAHRRGAQASGRSTTSSSTPTRSSRCSTASSAVTTAISRLATTRRLKALYDWTRDEVAYPALQRWIAAGHDASLLADMGYDPEVPPARSGSATARASSSRMGATRATT